MPLSGPRRRALVLAVVALAAWPAVWRVLQTPPPPQAFAVPAAAVEQVAPAPAVSTEARPVFRSVSGQPGAAVHAASGLLLRDGRLRAVWFSGSREGASDVSIRTAVFDPASGRWSPEKTALSRPDLAAATARYIKKLGNPVLARGADGRLHLYVVAVSLGGWAGSSITRLVSDDEGERWHSPRRLVTSPFLNLGTLVKGRPVAFPDGRVGLPVYHELIERFPEWLVLDADGGVQSRVRLPGSIDNLQPVLRVFDERRAELLMRHAADGTPARITRSHTVDGGRSWSAVEATGLPNPNAAVGVLVRRGGDALLVFNDTETGRGNLSLAWAPAPSRPPASDTGPEALPPQSTWQRLARLDGEPSERPPATPEAEYRALLARGVGAVDAGGYAGAIDSSGEPGKGPATVPVPGGSGDAVVAAAMRQLCYGPGDARSCNREFSYPSLVEGADGTVHLFYTWHRARILHLALPPAWLAARIAEVRR